MAENTVIIGAGGTGRGFLARLLAYDDASLTFVDMDQQLIRQLNEEKSYQIMSGNETYVIKNYKAYHFDDKEAAERVAEADWIFTAVGNEHLAQIVPLLERAAIKKTDQYLKVVTCENGMNPKSVLRKALEERNIKNVLVTQAIVFCTSIPESEGALAILSEDYNRLPYDTDEELFEMPFTHMISTKNFSQLLERKICTYNCLSACIAYLGAYKSYVNYADAANDTEILAICYDLLKGLNRAMCLEYKLSEPEQESFSDGALKKFRNHAISDTIQKNARAVIRKISPDERIMGPVHIMLRYSENPEVLYLVLAAALLYLEENEKTELEGAGYKEPIALFENLNPGIGRETIHTVRRLYGELRAGMGLEQIMKKG